MNQVKYKILIKLILGIWVLSLGRGICAEEVISLPDEFFNHWIHSHEDDTKEISVFRPSTYHFPPSRGRRGLEFKKNGEFIEYKISPADGLIKCVGYWHQKEKNKIVVQFKDNNIKSYSITLISVDKNMLKIKNPL